MDILYNPIEKLPNTSPTTIKRFKKIGILTFKDLLDYFPYKYKDFSIIKKTSEAEFGETVTVIGKILEKKQDTSKRGLKIQLLKVGTGEDFIWLVWFNQSG